MKYLISIFLFISSLHVFSGHHEANEILMPVAKPGQVIVIYRGEMEKLMNQLHWSRKR